MNIHIFTDNSTELKVDFRLKSKTIFIHLYFIFIATLNLWNALVEYMHIYTISYSPVIMYKIVKNNI